MIDINTRYLSQWNENISEAKERHYQGLKDRKDLEMTLKAISYVALSAIAMIATAILAPMYLPFASLAAILLTFPFTDKCLRPIKLSSLDYGNKVHRIQELRRLSTELQENNQDPLQIPMICYRLYLQKQYEATTKELEEAALEAENYETEHPDDLQKIVDLQNKALHLDRVALKARVHASFVTALSTLAPEVFKEKLLENEDLLKTFSDKAKILVYYPDKKQRGQYFNHPVKDHIAFTEGDFESLSLETPDFLDSISFQQELIKPFLPVENIAANEHAI